MASAKKKSLGKGLGAIFGDDIDAVISDLSHGRDELKGSEATEIAISEIRPNPYQPRKEFSEEALQELAASIRENGVFTPVLLRKSSISGYELVAGERRLRASKLAGKDKIPAIIVDYDDARMMEISLLENIQREDLTPIEEAEAYNQLIRKFRYTQEELARKLGKSRANISNLLRLLKLPEKVREMVNKGELSYGQARTILSAENEEKMVAVAEKTVREGLSVRELEKLCSRKTNKNKPVPKKVDPFVEDVRLRLQDKFSTRVDIKGNTISIRYNDTDDLNRILEIMDVIEN